MNKLKLNDVVVVLTGKDAGKTGKVLAYNSKTNKVIIEGVNEYKKAVKPTQESPEGGFAIKNLSIHRSNVALYSTKASKASRVKISINADGKKERVLVKCKTKI